MKVLKSFFAIINYKTFLMAILSVVSSYLCITYEIEAQFPFYLISIAIVFPIVFSIDSAYKRREQALQFYADLKAHAISYYLAARDWVGDKDPNVSQNVKTQVIGIFKKISENFLKTAEEAKASEKEVYTSFSKLAKNLEDYRKIGVSGSELSRMHQYVSKMMISYGVVRNIFFYRTPLTLRAYSKIFIYSFPVLYGPYSAYTYFDFPYHNMAYIIAILFSIILVSLDNLQEHLENPFDQVGEDDIHFEVEEMEEILNR